MRFFGKNERFIVALDQHLANGLFQFTNVAKPTMFGMCFELSPTYPKANDMLAVTAFVACFWVFEVLPLPVSSALALRLAVLLRK